MSRNDADETAFVVSLSQILWGYINDITFLKFGVLMNRASLQNVRLNA